MPRISAPTIAEHVERQESAILDAAGRLFAERGLAGTDLSAIAAEVGLARSSLYRYFPDKDHILLGWFERHPPPLVDAGASVLARDGTPADRVRAWFDHQVDLAVDASGPSVPRLAAEITGTALEVRSRIEEGMRSLLRPLEPVVAEALAAGAHASRDPALVVEIIGGAYGAGSRALVSGADPRAVKLEFHLLASGLLCADGALP